MFVLEEIKELLSRGKTVEEAMSAVNWKGFESVVSEIFSYNDFKTRNNFRFKTKRRYEIDILAVRGKNIFCVDCKDWARGRHKAAALRRAVEMQEERTNEFRRFLEKNFIARKMIGARDGSKIISLIVTLYDEAIVRHSSTWIVSSQKLNSFLNEFENLI